jgi:hypothetical protein
MHDTTGPVENADTTDPFASAWGRAGAYASWKKTKDRAARTAPARAALAAKRRKAREAHEQTVEADSGPSASGGESA